MNPLPTKKQFVGERLWPPITSIANRDSSRCPVGLTLGLFGLANSRISIMGKRHPHFPAWQWRTCLDHHGHPSNPVLHQIAVPLFIVAFLLMVSGDRKSTRLNSSH